MKANIILSSLAVLSLFPCAMAHAGDSFLSGDSEKIVGFGVGNYPEYEGAYKNRTIPLLFGEYKNANGFYASSLRGVGMSTQNGDFTINAGIGYRAGRADGNQRDWLFASDALKGMGEIPGTVTANLGVGYTFSPRLKLGVDASLALNHRDNGNIVHFSATPVIFQDTRNLVELSGRLSYSDGRYNQTYFGVTPQQAATSAYRVYSPSAGFSQVQASVNWLHMIDAQWSVRTTAGLIHLMGDTANSPLVFRKTNPAFFSTVNYRF